MHKIVNMIVALLFIIIIGLAMGSFFNAFAYRVGHEESITDGRSRCPNCRHQLAWFDLIPVISFALLRGRCRYCRKPISVQYPIVEIMTALIFVWLFVFFGYSSDFLFAAIVTLFLIPIFLTDTLYYLIPDEISIPAILVVFGMQLFRHANIVHVLAACAIGGGVFLLQYLISRGRWVGEGDIRVGVLMGAALGVPGVLIALFLSYVGGALIGIFLIASGRKEMSSRMPFGTVLTVATFLTLMYGEQIKNVYLRLAGFI